VLVLLTAQASTDAMAVARSIVSEVRGWPVPVLAAFAGGARVAPGAAVLEEAGIPCYEFPEPAVRALGSLAALACRHGGRPSAPGFPEAAAAARLIRSAPALGIAELAPALTAAGLAVAPFATADTPAEAATAAARLGGPVALKIRGADISHKTDVGGVALGLASLAAVRLEAEAMLARVGAARPGARIDGFTVQRMAPRGRELILGMVRDPQFGPCVLVGFGGVQVEVLRDTALRLAPVSADEALEMLAELRLSPLLDAFRGQPPVDRRALAEVIARFSSLAAATALDELEINPLLVEGSRAVAVDVRGGGAATDRRP
jgi:acetyltransferase